MQTLNLLDNRFSEFNTFKVFDSGVFDKKRRGAALLEQLQMTLDVEEMLNVFAIEAAKHVEFSGLYFKNEQYTQRIKGSRPSKAERRFPLTINNQLLGTLTYAINKPISKANFKILEDLHQYLVFPLRNALSYQEAMALAMQDGLTGLGNRRYFDKQLKRAMQLASRNHSVVGLIVGDLNKFKMINDTYGHGIGDQVLINFANVLQKCVRDSDCVFRFGGDEFAIIVEHANEESLLLINQRIEQKITENDLLNRYKVSCSLGSTFMNQNDEEMSFFNRADEELYHNKAQ